MRTTFFIILLTCLAHLSAQTDEVSNDLVVLSSKGTVTYSNAAGGEDIAAIPGLRLPKKGSIFVDEGARVRIVVMRRSVLLTGPGRYDLAEIVNNTKTKSMSFTSRFWNFVMEGMGSTDDKKDLIKYHRDYMKIHGGIKGYTQEGSVIQLLNPIGGKVASQDIVFTWKIEDHTSSVQFELLDSHRKTVIEMDIPKGKSTFKLENTAMQSGTDYYWSITQGKNHAETKFTYLNQVEEDILEKLTYLEDYIDADEIERMWMKAVILEMENYPYEANQIYKQLIADNSNNAFWKENYALFMSRHSRLNEATRLLNYK